MVISERSQILSPGAERHAMTAAERALTPVPPLRVPAALQAAGRLLGRLAAAVDIGHRRVVRRNLRFVYPDWPPEKVRRMTREVFENMGMLAAEILAMRRMTREELLARVEKAGEEHVRQALAAERGLIVVSAHLGNWEMALQVAACYFDRPVNVVVKPMRLPAFDRWLEGFRGRLGARVVTKVGSLPEMSQALRRREVVCLLVDQSRRSEGLEVRFMGRRVTTTPAVAMLALRHRSPVVPIFCVRQASGGLRLEAAPALAFQRTGRLRDDLQVNTQRVTDAVEGAVRRYPAQWLWAHKRWKKFYPELYPEYQARRRRRRAGRRGPAPDGGG
jgi:KDO2-lipid IV(A) lauroyltransferase